MSMDEIKGTLRTCKFRAKQKIGKFMRKKAILKMPKSD
jgi:hypothetical protein